MQRNDILWKGILEDFLIEFLQFFFYNANKIFDFSRKGRFLDKELAELFPQGELKHPKRIDSLIELHTMQGKEEWLLVHVEVQGYRELKFAERVFTYYYRLTDKYKKPVTCIVIYLGSRNKSNVPFFESECLGTKIRLDFNTYYIGEQDEDELKKSNNPFAVVVLTALIALKHRKNVEQLFNSKITLAKNLFKAGYGTDKVRKLLNFIKLYIHFEQPELNIKFDNEIKLLTNKTTETMGVLEQVRELLEEQVREEGKREGKLEGELKAKTSIARKLKSLGVSASLIAKSTGLSLKKIREL